MQVFGLLLLILPGHYDEGGNGVSRKAAKDFNTPSADLY
jgi:hypothetical protein